MGVEEEQFCYDTVDSVFISGESDEVSIGQYAVGIKDIKPYLFPISNITNQQLEELQSYMIKDSYGILYHTLESYDYLYRNNIDVRGLIPMRFAIDATGLNIY